MARVLLGLDYSSPVWLELFATASGVNVVASFTTAGQAGAFADLLVATHPGAETEDVDVPSHQDVAVGGIAIEPKRPDYIPLAVKPAPSVLSTLIAVCCAGLQAEESAMFRLYIESGNTKSWRDRAEDLGETIIKRTDLGGDALRALFGFSSSQAAQRQIGESIVTKSQSPLLVRAQVSFVVASPSRARVAAIVNRAISVVRSLSGSLMNPLTAIALPQSEIAVDRPPRGAFLMTAFELALLWGLPGRGDNAPASMFVSGRRVPASFEVPSIGIVIGKDPGGRSVAIGERDFPLHAGLFGRTGSGKTTVLARMAVGLAEHGYSLILIDPKDGSLLELVVANLPASRLQDCVQIDAADPDYVVGLSPLRGGQGIPDFLVAADMASAFQKMLGAYWSARIESILTAAFRACLALGLTNLTAVWPVLNDTTLRRQAINALADPLAVDTLREIDAMTPARRSGALAPIRNRLSVLLSNPAARDIIGQRAGLDLRQALDRGAIVLARLPSGLIGEDASSTIGALIITMAQHAAHNRSAFGSRQPVALVADEAQRFTTAALVRVLSEARAFNLSLLLASQYIGQLTDDIRDAVLANASVLLQFAASPAEVRLWHGRLAPFGPDDVVNLPRFQAAATVPSGAQRPPAFTLVTMPFETDRDPDRWDQVRQQTIQRYARPRAEVQAELDALGRRRSVGSHEESAHTLPDVDEE